MEMNFSAEETVVERAGAGPVLVSSCSSVKPSACFDVCASHVFLTQVLAVSACSFVPAIRRS